MRMMISVPEVRLETPRLVLRELETGDAGALQAMSADPDITRFVDWPLKTVTEHEAFVRDTIAGRSKTPRAAYRLAIAGREDGAVRGFIRLHVFGAPDESAELGYYLFKPYWGSGMATEAGKAAVAFAFERLGAPLVVSHCDARNAASARVLEKIGLRRVKTGPQDTGSGPRQAHFYELTRPD